MVRLQQGIVFHAALTQLSGDWMAIMAHKYEHSETGTAAEQRITRMLHQASEWFSSRIRKLLDARQITRNTRHSMKSPSELCHVLAGPNEHNN